MVPRPDNARLADPFTWPDQVGWPSASALTASSISTVVAGRPPTRVDPYGDAWRASAVMVLLSNGPQGAEVLLTRRSMDLGSHKGEVSFPGGRLDLGETFEQAALREAHEEVGAVPSEIEIVGRLDPLNTLVSRSYIVPVVAQSARRPDLYPATAEVDSLFWVPLVDLLRPDTYREERWGSEPNAFSLFFYELDDETVWGATAKVLTQLLSVALGHGPPAIRTAL